MKCLSKKSALMQTLGDLVKGRVNIELVPGIVLFLYIRPGATEGQAWLTEDAFGYNDQGDIELMPNEIEVSEIMGVTTLSEIICILKVRYPGGGRSSP